MPSENSIPLLVPITGFLIFVFNYFAIPFLFRKLFPNGWLIHPVEISVWMTFANGALNALLLVGFLRSLYPPIARDIWKRSMNSSYLKDVGAACITYVISFPLILFISGIAELLIYLIFHIKTVPDQTAILFLKSTFTEPLYFSLATVSIVLLAPFIEEFLFRGCIQNYFRRFFQPRISIFITSILFALFHYSKTQGVGNISILPSIFVLSCFLGFVYERQGSLLAPITFHSLFNIINIANLYFGV